MGRKPEYPGRDKKILEAYERGLYVSDIAKILDLSESSIRHIIKKEREKKNESNLV